MAQKNKYSEVFSCFKGAVSFIKNNLKAFATIGLFYISVDLIISVAVEYNNGHEEIRYLSSIVSISYSVLSVLTAIIVIMLVERDGRLFFKDLKKDIKENFFPLFVAYLIFSIYLLVGGLVFIALSFVIYQLFSIDPYITFIPVFLYIAFMWFRYVFIAQFTVIKKQNFAETRKSTIKSSKGYKFPLFLICTASFFIISSPLVLIYLNYDIKQPLLPLLLLESVLLYVFTIFFILSVHFLWKRNIEDA